MLTRPAKFTPFQNSIGTDFHPIVSLNDGTTTWLFSDTEMQLTDGHVYAGLLNGWSIDQSLDIYSKQWAVSDVTIEITNLPYRISAGADVRFSSEVAGLFGGVVKIYLMAGRTAAALSDCLLRFSGKAMAAPTYDDQTVTITATDASRLKTVELPQNNVGDSYSGAPKIYKTYKIPLVYGKFTIDSENLDGSGKGLARAIQVTPGCYCTFVVSDHILHALTELWYEDHTFTDPVKWIDPTLDNDDADHRGSGVVDKYVQAWIFPTSGDDEGFATEAISSASGTSDCFDRSTSTYDIVSDNYVQGDGSTNYPEGKFMLALDQDDWIKRQAELAQAGFDTGFKVQLKGIDNTGKVNTDREARFMYASTGSADSYTSVSIGSSTSWQEQPSATWEAIPVTSKNMPYVLGFWFKGRIADGTGEGYGMYIIYEARILVKYPASGTPGIGGFNMAWAACEGREYGSWITSRSSNYADGDCIIDPAGMVESILRDEVGLADADLELTTFIAAENTSVEARLNLHSDNKMISDEAIRRLAEQSTFAFFYSANGKARLIPLNNATPTTAVRGSHPIHIPWTHIKDGGLRVGTVGQVINYLDIESRFMQEYDSFGDASVVQNSTSQSTYGGTYKYSASWPNISGTSVTTVANHLVGSANGIWANDHVQIEVETVGFTYADLEIGDWIEFDATTVDPFIKCYGTSWSGLQFLVTGLRQSNESTMITAIKLY
ncbi:MAG: hypothetical protein WC455_12235 [Dehalococcoidia bacterium]|jgi:hypothetical protein